MNSQITYLKNYFKEIKLLNKKVILNKNTLNLIETNYNNSLKTLTSPVIMNKPYGIIAVTDKYSRNYTITTFHYLNFRWYSLQSGAKIMHKANIEERQGSNNYSCKFSKSPMRYSGDVVGMMPGDFRDCFDEIITKEKEHELLFESKISTPIENSTKTINIQCGIGLESLTRIEKITKETRLTLSLIFVK